MELFGENFERYEAEEAQEVSAPTETPDGAASTTGPARVDKATKGKVAAKATGLRYQFQIMESIGVPRAEIKKFADPYYWLEYFPPICMVCVFRSHARRVVLISDVVRSCRLRFPHRLASLVPHNRRQPVLRFFRSLADKPPLPIAKNQVR